MKQYFFKLTFALLIFKTNEANKKTTGKFRYHV